MNGLGFLLSGDLGSLIPFRDGFFNLISFNFPKIFVSLPFNLSCLLGSLLSVDEKLGVCSWLWFGVLSIGVWTFSDPLNVSWNFCLSYRWPKRLNIFHNILNILKVNLFNIKL